MTEREHKLKLARIEAEHADKVLEVLADRLRRYDRLFSQAQPVISADEMEDAKLMLLQAKLDKLVADANLEMEEVRYKERTEQLQRAERANAARRQS